MILKYNDVAVDRKHKTNNILFYADDTPISINCAAWLSNSGLLEKESKLIVLYGPNYAEGSSGEASFLDDKSISLSRLKGIIKDTGISTEKVEVRFIEPGKKAKLSPKYKELCLECAACYAVCEADAIDFRYPNGGSGIIIKHG